MKTLQTITVTIDLNAESKVEASGFTGDSCLKETKSVEEALGKLTHRDLKPEAAKKSTIADKTKIGN